MRGTDLGEEHDGRQTEEDVGEQQGARSEHLQLLLEAVHTSLVAHQNSAYEYKEDETLEHDGR